MKTYNKSTIYMMALNSHQIILAYLKSQDCPWNFLLLPIGIAVGHQMALFSIGLYILKTMVDCNANIFMMKQKLHYHLEHGTGAIDAQKAFWKASYRTNAIIRYRHYSKIMLWAPKLRRKNDIKMTFSMKS